MEEKLITCYKYKIKGNELILSIEQIEYMIELLYKERDELKQDNEKLNNLLNMSTGFTGSFFNESYKLQNKLDKIKEYCNNCINYYYDEDLIIKQCEVDGLHILQIIEEGVDNE